MARLNERAGDFKVLEGGPESGRRSRLQDAVHGCTAVKGEGDEAGVAKLHLIGAVAKGDFSADKRSAEIVEDDVVDVAAAFVSEGGEIAERVHEERIGAIAGDDAKRA